MAPVIGGEEALWEGHEEWHLREIDASFLEPEGNVPPVLCVDRGWMTVDCIDAIERDDGVKGGGWKEVAEVCCEVGDVVRGDIRRNVEVLGTIPDGLGSGGV